MSELTKQRKLFENKWKKLSVPKENTNTAERFNSIFDQLKTHDREMGKLINDASNVYAKIDNHTDELYQWYVQTFVVDIFLTYLLFSFYSALESANSWAEQVQISEQLKLNSATILQGIREYLVN